MKYRKKPLIVEAYQFIGNKVCTTLPRWLEDAHGRGEVRYSPGVQEEEQKLHVDTPEGTMTANLGDWIIKGVQGELYPCKPDIFAETYEAIE